MVSRGEHGGREASPANPLVLRVLLFCFLRLSWHGAKNSCDRASSEVILHLGLTARHLSTRSNRESGNWLRNSGLRALATHQSLRSTDCRNLASNNSWKTKGWWFKDERLRDRFKGCSHVSAVSCLPMGMKIHSCAISLLPIILRCLWASLFPSCSCLFNIFHNLSVFFNQGSETCKCSN